MIADYEAPTIVLDFLGRRKAAAWLLDHAAHVALAVKRAIAAGEKAKEPMSAAGRQHGESSGAPPRRAPNAAALAITQPTTHSRKMTILHV